MLVYCRNPEVVCGHFNFNCNIMMQPKKFVFFANYFDAILNAIFAIAFIVVSCSGDTPKELILFAVVWAIELYLSMVISNGGRPIASIFAVPLKAIFSTIFIFALAVFLRAIFGKKDSPSAKLSNGLISGFILWIFSRLINPNKIKNKKGE